MRKCQATPYSGGLLILLVFLLAGCAGTPQTSRLLEQQRTDPLSRLPQSLEIKQVPFNPQKKYQCGPAALATMLQNSGITISSTDLVPEIYLPARHGSLQIEILAASRRYGRVAYQIEPDMQTLFKEITAGNPVLVLQNLGLSWLPTWHYAVVVGYDLENEIVILRSGINKRHQTSLQTFEHTWARGKYWGIVILPPDKLPETALENKFIKTIVAFEKINRWQDAIIAYETALHRWPGNLIAQIGLGNSYYMQKNLLSAEASFRSAADMHPDSGAAFNNLAHVLLEQGKINEAESMIKRAINIGGPQLKNYQDTLEEIKQQKK